MRYFAKSTSKYSDKRKKVYESTSWKVKEILNRLYSIEERVESYDLIRYALKAFPLIIFWASMVDAYKVSEDLSSIKLDKLFCEYNLHEQINLDLQEKCIALVASKSDIIKVKGKSKAEFEVESKLEPSTDGEDISSEITNIVKKMRRRKNFTKRGVKEIQKKD